MHPQHQTERVLLTPYNLRLRGLHFVHKQNYLLISYVGASPGAIQSIKATFYAKEKGSGC